LAVRHQQLSVLFIAVLRDTLQPIPYDPDRAKAIFSKVDLPSELVFRTPTFMPDRAVETSTYIVEQLSKIGLPAKIDIMKDRPEYAREGRCKKNRPYCFI
jgi:peptide/nickel transport system substrate-binding protein